MENCGDLVDEEETIVQVAAEEITGDGGEGGCD